MDININVTESAVEYLGELLESVNMQDPKAPKSHIRVFIQNGGTPYAETMLTYCKEEDAGDSEIMPYKSFNLYIDKGSIKFLDEAEINYDRTNFGG